MNEIHELDLDKTIAGREDAPLLDLLHELTAVLTCSDSSMKERIKVAVKARMFIEERLGQNVHWMNGFCDEGECDVCRERSELQE